MQKPLDAPQIKCAPDVPRENGKVNAVDHQTAPVGQKEDETPMDVDSVETKASGIFF